MSTNLHKNIFLTSFDFHLELQFEDTGKVLKLYYIWLRDYCRCSECYNIETNQILSNLLNIALDIKPLQCSVSSDTLKITWQDGHVSRFDIAWLINNYFPETDGHDTVLWDGNSVSNLEDTKISVTEFFKNENGLKRLLVSLKKYGFGFVTEVEPTLKATEDICKHIGAIKNTLFGEMWYLNADIPQKDTAYSKIALGPHTDNTYFSDASGLQVLHALDTDGIGGESILVDGFNAANILKKTHPSQYHILSNTHFEAQYLEENYHFSNVGTVIQHHPITQRLLQIRYNTSDRAPLTLVHDDNLLTFYEAYQTFGKIVNDPNNVYRFKLKPGTVLFFDNWRLLHGRTAYQGKRVFGGCYIARDDWVSKARLLGVHI